MSEELSLDIFLQAQKELNKSLKQIYEKVRKENMSELDERLKTYSKEFQDYYNILDKLITENQHLDVLLWDCWQHARCQLMMEQSK